MRQLVVHHREKVLPSRAVSTRTTHEYHLDCFSLPLLVRDPEPGDIIAMIEGVRVSISE
ncbi:hypothetical protein LJ656_32980 [Paraburkholderia sp. MMS20-SJTR3]|uniref:Uncharacterized protein n=1 Tax=Paraburkholderia sejongensis TaxID=2886946 RepID=A0ABS8K676_9BURK|nr:hypothetical protein [Paraburkholderia sp. MMS20-SJTR3]MCC8397378.1 hypothetical protein [Paraburkholderia sp. MMS20-SJTR3]